MAENRLAVDVFSDLKSIGWEATAALNRLDLTDYARGDLLMKLRTLSSIVSEIEREKMSAPRSGG